MWKTVPVHGVPAVLLLGGFSSKYFDADRKFIEAVSGCETMKDVEAALSTYESNVMERSWLRTLLGLEISAWRLRYFARRYLRGTGTDHFLIFNHAGN